MFIHFFKRLIPIILFFYTQQLSGQTVIWEENFLGAPPAPGWNANFVDCDGTPETFAGVQGGRFEVIDMEGAPCCPAGMSVGGGNNNEWETNDIDIAGYCNVTISVAYGSIGTFECSAGGPYFACTGDPFVENGHDQMLFEYSLDGGPFVEFLYLCGGGTGTASINGLSGNTIRVRIRPANKSVGETYWFDDVRITGVQPIVNPIDDVEGCAGTSFSVSFSGTGNPAPTFSWTNDNTAIGLGASGMGNSITINPPIGLSNQETATITVTPMSAGCSGDPETFMVTVFPGPLTNDPPNIVACAGDFVEVIFSGTDPSAIYEWTVTNVPFFPPSGEGDISGTVPPIPFSINGSVTVQAVANGCTGPSQTFNVTLHPAISATFTMTSPANLCAGQSAAFTVNFSGGSAPYTFTYAIDGVNQAPLTTNNDPFNFTIPLTADAMISAVGMSSGNGCVQDVDGDFNITVNPAPTATLPSGTTNICEGGDLDLEIEFNGSNDYTFTYTINGIPQPAITATGPNFTLTVNPPNGSTTYTLTSVNSNGCTGTASGSQVSNITPIPTAFISGNPMICSGQNASVQVTFSGTAPWTFVYAVDGIDQAPITTNSSPYTITGTYNATTTLELVSVASGSCDGTTSGSALIAVQQGVIGVLASDTTAVCVGDSDTLRFSFSGMAPFTFTYTLNGVPQAPITTSDTLYLIPITPAVQSVYVLTMVGNSNCPNGSASGTYSVGVVTPPTATISGSDTICGIQPMPLSISFTGTAPWTFAYSANGIPVDTITTSSNPFILTVNPLTPTTYALTSVSSGNCMGSVSGTATIIIYPNPTATISGGGQICQIGNGTDIIIDFTGTAPWTVTYTANNDTLTVTSTVNPLIIPVNPNSGTIYTLLSVSDSICSNTASGQAIVFVFTPANALLMGSATFCDSANTEVIVDFTGTGPFILNYTINGVAQAPDTTFDDPYVIPLNVTSTTTVELTSIESPGCDGIISGDPAVITINYPPSYANLNLICDAIAGNYVVTFDVLGATLPLVSVGGLSGTFNGNQWTSDPIPQAMGYSFTFRDANNCADISVSGPSICNCETEAGTMNLTLLNACEDEVVTATYNGGFFNDGNDTLLYILHQNPALPIGTIYAWNNTPSFGFQAGMVFGTTYYISAIAGDISAGGLVDTSDICFKVSQGTPVVFHAFPAASLSPANASICQGDPVTLTLSFTGTAPFSFSYSIDNVPQTPITGITTSTYDLSFTPGANAVVTLTGVSDAFCSSGQLTGTTNISLTPPPVIGNVQTVCDFTTATYTVSFDIISGTAPFNVSGIAGFFSANSFTSIPMPFAMLDFFATFTDANNCGQDTIAGTANCNCFSNAGTMSQDTLEICQNLPLTVPAALNPALDLDDTLMYILHTNPSVPLGTIVGWSATSTFTFAPPMQTGITYYVSSIVGNPDGVGTIDLMDPCLSVSVGTPVIWLQTPTATLAAGNYNICPGGTQSLLVNLTGTPNFTLGYTNNGNAFSVTATQTAFLLNATLQQTATFILTSVSDANCTGTVSGSVVVTVHPAPVAANFVPTCSPVGQTYILEFDVTQGDLSTIVVASPAGSYDPATGHFVSNPIPAGQPYTVSITDSWNCGTFTFTDVVNCVCNTEAGIMDMTPLNPCFGQTVNTSTATGTFLEPGDTLLYFLVSQANTPPGWVIVEVSNTPNFAFNPATMQVNTTYFIVAVAGNIGGSNGVNLSDPCLSLSNGPTVIWRPEITAVLSGAPSVCPGASATIQVTFTGDGPFNFTYTDGSTPQTLTNITENPYSILVNPSITTNYTLVNVTGAGDCPGTISGTASVTISTAPQALNLVVACDFATETYTLVFDIGNGTQPNPVYTVLGVQGTLVDTTFTSISYPGTQPYNVIISSPTGCTTTLSGMPNCVCTTNAGVVSNGVNGCLPDGIVSAQPATGTSLDPEDVLVYVLCTDPTTLPLSIVATSNSPSFAFQAGLTAGITYYIVAVAGNSMAGSVDLTDPCLSFSSGVPVVFHFQPSALLVGDATLCAGANASFQVQLAGVGPFNFVYALNGVPQTPVSTSNNSFNILSNNVQQNQVFTLVSLNDANCPGLIEGQATVTVAPTPFGQISSNTSICEGGTATLTLTLTGGTDFDVTISGSVPPTVLTGVQNGATFDVSPSSTTTYTITNLVATGTSCPAKFGPSATVNISTPLATSILSDFNGFNTSCPLADDGSITITPVGGIPPITASWSNGQTGFVNSNLPAGDYFLTLTDQIGCTFTNNYTLTAPPELSLEFNVIAPTCFGDRDGSIILTGVSGGAGPFALSLNGNAVQTINTFPVTLPGLESGLQVIGLEDANGCLSDADVSVPSPPELFVNLGPDLNIYLGDSVLLQAILNFTDIESFQWSPLEFLRTPDSLSTYSTPFNSMRYTLQATNSAGCVASDNILVVVSGDKRVYIPNIFKPSSNDLNDRITVFAGTEVRSVRSMQIYDRWGELLFENQNFLPNDPQMGWGGQAKGQDVNPGVYVYVVEVEYVNGETEVFAGDVTLVR